MKIVFPEHLPVSQQREPIAEAVRRHPVTIVCGDTGSGKTTQLPKIAIELGRGRGREAGGKRIGCTQPRRLAATSVARRVAEEMAVKLGEEVGHQIRFEDRCGPRTVVKFMTDGVLLAETRRDPQLRQYDTLIVDEAHERSLNIDFILGYLKRLLERRNDLKVIISSATLDAATFSNFFGGAPVISVAGRTYPVEDVFLPPLRETERLADHVLRAVEWLGELDPLGDTLVFLPGEREIHEAADLLQGRKLRATTILPLFSRQAGSEQQEVFRTRPGMRRVILATNVAETSLTIPDIRSVVDAGLARVNRYDPRSGIERLLLEPVSQASAKQRRGRCGRVADGICVKLYDEEDLQQRPLYTDPEIRRCNLAGVVLQMEHLGLGDPLQFPFVDPPQPKRVAQAYQTLEEIGAIRKRGGLTEIGHELARIPVDPRVGRLLVEARRLECLREGLVLACALSVQDPRERPQDRQEAADQAHARFRDPRSDFTGWLRWWQGVDAAARKSNNALRRFCQENFLNYRRAQEWRSLHRELREVLRDLRWTLPDDAAPMVDPEGTYSEPVHRAVLAAVPSQIGFKEPRQPGYQGAGGRAFFLHPGSGTQGKGLTWIMAFELVETAKLYARNVAAFDPSWFEKAAPHLCRYRYSDPQWDAAQGAVYGKESVLAYGLAVVEGRRVHFGRVDPAKAREIFIWEALVNGTTRSPIPAMAGNRERFEWVRGLERKLRRRDGLLFPQGIFGFFDERLPADCCTQKAFERWAAQNPQSVDLAPEDCMVPLTGEVEEWAYPERLDLPGGERSLELCYHHNPADDEDGITLRIPLVILSGVPDWCGDWLVPGWLPEKVASLLRTLDKNTRERLPPLAEVAERFLADWEGYEPQCGLLEALQDFVQTNWNQHVPADSFELDRLPRHLRMRFEVIGEQGESLAAGRDLARLREHLRSVIEERIARAAQTAFAERRATGWIWEEIPRQVTVEGGLVGYPGLRDRRDGVTSRVFSSAVCASEHHRWGVARLWLLTHATEAKRLRRELFEPGGAGLGVEWRSGAARGGAELTSLAAAFGDPRPAQGVSFGNRSAAQAVTRWTRDEVLALDHAGSEPRENREELLLGLVVQAMGGADARSRDQFERLGPEVSKALFRARAEVLGPLVDILRRQRALRELVGSLGNGFAESLDDARESWRGLFEPGWVRWAATVGWQRYALAVEGLEIRLRRMASGPPAKDVAKMERFWSRAEPAIACRCGERHPVPESVTWWVAEHGRRLQEFAPELRGRWEEKRGEMPSKAC